MSAATSAALYNEDDGNGGTIPVVVYNKATMYFTKQSGDRFWQTNNWYGIKGSSTDIHLTNGSIGTLTFEDNTAFQIWGNDDTSIHISNIGEWFNNTFQIDNGPTLGLAISTFNSNSNTNVDSNLLISNLNIVRLVQLPNLPIFTSSTNWKNDIGINIASWYCAAINATLTGDTSLLNNPDIDESISSSSIYFQRGILTQSLGYSLINGMSDSITVNWDWTDDLTVVSETVALTSLAFTAGASAGWVSNLFRGRILAGMIAVGTGGSATVGTVLEEEGDSIAPKIDTVIVNTSDSIPAFLTSNQLQNIQINVQQLAPKFGQITMAQQNSLIMQQLALKLHGVSTVINIVAQPMSDSFIVEYEPNAALPSPLIQMLFKYDSAGRALLEFQLNNGGNNTIH